MLFCGHAFLRIVNTKDFFCKTSWEFLRTPFFLLRKFPTFLQFYKRICENLRKFAFPCRPCQARPLCRDKRAAERDAQGRHFKKNGLEKI